MLVAQEIYLEKNKRVFLNHISISFKMGNVHGILGPNGAGKSTLLKTLAGIWKPTSGKVVWKGESVLEQPRAKISRTISLVPQNPQPAFHFTVQEMVGMGRYSHQDKDKEKVQYALEAVDGWQFRHLPITDLSQGEKQRIFIARSLATDAPVILLDEPTASLDIRHQVSIWKLLRTLAMQDKVIIVAVHDLHAAERYCDQVSIINKGECIASGTYAETFTPELIDQLF